MWREKDQTKGCGGGCGVNVNDRRVVHVHLRGPLEGHCGTLRDICVGETGDWTRRNGSKQVAVKQKGRPHQGCSPTDAHRKGCKEGSKEEGDSRTRGVSARIDGYGDEAATGRKEEAAGLAGEGYRVPPPLLCKVPKEALLGLQQAIDSRSN